ncbi:ABC transporter permease, partial [Streptomyces sp. NPDC049744]|uniref:ABC transporter permease n=1 Tax=Streptomyces sp. NPDC049744 TaxID=3154359 RepID=UPI00344531CF
MRRPNGLAREAVRFKPASFAGTFLALLMSALIVAACGILLETSLRASVPTERYANAPVLVAADQYEYVVTGSGEDQEREATPLPDIARLDAGLWAKAAKAPGAATAVPDFTFPVRVAHEGELSPPGDLLTAHGWGSHTFTGTALTAGSAPRGGEVVLDAGAAHAAKVAVGGTVVLQTAVGQQDFRVAGLAQAGTADTAHSAGPLAWFADSQAPVLAGHPGKADAIAVLAQDGTDADELADTVKKTLAGSGALVHIGDDRGAVEDPGLGYAKDTLFGIGGSFGGIAAIVAVFTAAGTVALSVSQRVREFALLRAVGATPRQVRRAVAAEA